MLQRTKLMHFWVRPHYAYSVSDDVFLIHHNVCRTFRCTNMFWLKIETKSSVIVYFFKNIKLSLVVWQRCILGASGGFIVVAHPILFSLLLLLVPTNYFLCGMKNTYNCKTLVKLINYLPCVVAPSSSHNPIIVIPKIDTLGYIKI